MTAPVHKFDHVNGLHSVHSDVWEALKVQNTDKVVGAHRRFAQVSQELDEADTAQARLFARYESCKADLEAVGVVAQKKMSAQQEAGYRQWIRAETDQPLPRVFTEIPDPPIGPEHA